MTAQMVRAGYLEALERHVSDGKEAALLSAYELGREMMQEGLGVLDIVHVHADALERLRDRMELTPELRRGGDTFLAEVLAPFEMAYLGFQEANSALRELTGSLETEVERRTRELQATIGALQAADAERRRLTERVVGAQEQERDRIAHDLHDDTIQVMTAAALRLSMLRGSVDEADQALVDQLEATVSEAITRLRRLVFELRPPDLDDAGLASAIRLYLRTVFPEDVDCEVRDDLAAEPAVGVREIAYRIVQEALVNARKHAHAREVRVVLASDHGGLRVRVTDDGVGFDPARLDLARPGHLGMLAMRDRAQMVGGRLDIDSQPGSGTIIEFWIPTDAGPGGS